MTEISTNSQEEVKRLRIRLKELGKEKANLQMAVDLINKISTVVGLENVVDHILQILMEAVGGSNITIYYETEGRWRYTDVLGKKKWMDEPDDPIVKQVIQDRTFIKVARTDKPETQLPGFLENEETWVYPLFIGDQFFGAIRLEGMALVHAHYRASIDPFIHYAGLALYHEVSNIRRIETAYQEVKKAREDLSIINQLLTSVIDNSPLAILALDLDKRVTLWSRAAERMFGWSSEETIGSQSPVDIEASEENYSELYSNVLSGQRITGLEVERQRKDGLKLDVSLSVAPIVDTEKKLQGTMAIIGDISRRKRAEEALRKSEAQLQAILDHSPALISTKDLNAKVTMVNKRFEVLSGPPSKDFVGKSVYDLFPYEIADALWKNDLAALESGGPIEAEEVVKHKDGSWHTYLTVKFPMFEEANKPYGVCAISTDITDRKLVEQQLLQAQKVEAIGTLAGGIAHDFNNILAPIIGCTELSMEDVQKDTTLYNNMQEVLLAGMRAKDLVKQILTFSRQSDRELKPLRVQLIIKEVLKLIRSTLPSTIEIRQDISDKCGLVMADQSQIHQIAMNLMTNAYHAMQETGGSLEVTLKEVELGAENSRDLSMVPGPYICLTVADTGIGMEQTVMDRIFDPYFTTKEKNKGTGLGLSVVHGIVKSFRGEIKVYSNPGKGTSFHVYLPVIKTKVETVEDKTIAPIEGGMEQILLIDDEEPIVRMEKQILERLGYHVTARTSSVEALEAFRADPDNFDLVITDMTMPNLTGVQLSKELLKIRPGIPIIICTGFSEQISEDKAKEMGIRGYVLKPVVKSEIAKTIRTILEDEQ